jgi:hypothetical protein
MTGEEMFKAAYEYKPRGNPTYRQVCEELGIPTEYVGIVLAARCPIAGAIATEIERARRD